MREKRQWVCGQTVVYDGFLWRPSLHVYYGGYSQFGYNGAEARGLQIHPAGF